MFRLCLEARSRTAQSGVTIIEVLFSIGVMAIGILGVISLLPLAGHQVRKGVIEDRKAIVGRNAVQEFDLRGMRRTDQWVKWNPATSAFAAAGTPAAGSSFLIDPRFLNPQTATSAAAGFNRSHFPYTDAINSNITSVTMPRITLRRSPSASSSTMTFLQADQIFQPQDDLVFNLPDDRTLPPVQEFGHGERRQFAGRMSWMAMLTPKLDIRYNSLNDLYSLSIIVFFNRDATMSMDATNERVLSVGSFPGGGISGGDVVLASLNLVNPVAAQEDLELQEGDWVLLRTLIPAASAPLPTPIPFFRWYQVVFTDNEPAIPAMAGDPWTRAATLQGPDWPLTAAPTQAVLMPGVVAVYEKTIRLESSSLWE